MRAGEWQGIPVAIKTVVFQGGDDQTQSSLIVSEAAIASNLFHKNVVATYCHDVRSLMCGGVGNEEGVFKFYLLQVPPPPPVPPLRGDIPLEAATT